MTPNTTAAHRVDVLARQLAPAAAAAGKKHYEYTVDNDVVRAVFKSPGRNLILKAPSSTKHRCSVVCARHS